MHRNRFEGAHSSPQAKRAGQRGGRATAEGRRKASRKKGPWAARNEPEDSRAGQVGSRVGTPRQASSWPCYGVPMPTCETSIVNKTGAMVSGRHHPDTWEFQQCAVSSSKHGRPVARRWPPPWRALEGAQESGLIAGQGPRESLPQDQSGRSLAGPLPPRQLLSRT